jgi:hypothetical protein
LNYDPSAFVTAGDQFANPQQVPASLHVLEKSSGYDGQFYYRLALDPFTAKRTDFGITLDAPENRQSRIVYPLLSWLLSLGRAELVPAVMLLVNYLAVCLIAWLGGIYAQSIERHAGWGLGLAFYAGFLLTLTRDLTEIVASAFLLASLLLLRRNRAGAAALILTLGVLTKETLLLAVLAALLAWLIQKRKHQETNLTWYYAVVPLLVYTLWQLVLFFHWGSFPLTATAGNIGMPFGSVIPFLLQTSALNDHFLRVWFLELCFILTFSGAVLYALRSTAAALQDKLAWFLYAAFALAWTSLVWVEDWAFMRQLAEFYLFGVILLLSASSRIKYPVVATSLALWLYIFRDLIFFR